MTVSTPLVSIVTPSFNQAEYLEYTIRSVLEQDYPAIEYIIVDGGSQDSSLEIIQKYASRLAWWVSEPDQGQASAINKGMARAQGEYVAWVNSDDLYLPGAVRQAVAALEEDRDLGMVYGDALAIDSEGRLLNRFVFPEWDLKDFVAFRIICQPSVFMRKTFFNRAGGLNRDLHYELDHFLWIRIAEQARVKHVPAMWSAARYHREAKNVKQAERYGLDIFKLLDWMEADPNLAPIILQQRRRVRAGAYRLTARYSLDGGDFWGALKYYGKALIQQPSYALKHWHRMLYALLGLAGLREVGQVYYRIKRNRLLPLSDINGLSTWPGLSFEQAK